MVPKRIQQKHIPTMLPSRTPQEHTATRQGKSQRFDLVKHQHGLLLLARLHGLILLVICCVAGANYKNF